MLKVSLREEGQRVTPETLSDVSQADVYTKIFQKLMGKCQAMVLGNWQ